MQSSSGDDDEPRWQSVKPQIYKLKKKKKTESNPRKRQIGEEEEEGIGIQVLTCNKRWDFDFLAIELILNCLWSGEKSGFD